MRNLHREGQPEAFSQQSAAASAARPGQMEGVAEVLSAVLAKTIFIAGPPNERCVREFCGRFGSIVEVTMAHEAPKSKQWAFVSFTAAEDAEAAIDAAATCGKPKNPKKSSKKSAIPKWEATVQIKAAAKDLRDLMWGLQMSKELAAHVARVSVLMPDPAVSKQEEDAVEEAMVAEGRLVPPPPGATKNKTTRKRKAGVENAEAQDASTDVDLLIIGAGASGIGCGVMAKKFGVDPSKTLIVERGSAVGSTFDKWPAEMRFITPSFNQQAFGMMDLNSIAFDTSPAVMFHEEHPSGQQYAEYLRFVAQKHKLPVVLDTDVTSVTPVKGVQHGSAFEVSVKQSRGATRKVGPKIRAKFVIWAAGEFQYPSMDGFPGASEHCVHNSRVSSWEKLGKNQDEKVVIGGYESGMDATVHLANAGVDVTVFASVPFWSVRTKDPSTELAPFTANRLEAAMKGAHPPTLASHCRVVKVEPDGKRGGGYVVTAVKNRQAADNDPAWDHIKSMEDSTVASGEPNTVCVKTRSKPVLATGFSSGVGKVVNHLFDWTEESLCSSAHAAAAAADLAAGAAKKPTAKKPKTTRSRRKQQQQQRVSSAESAVAQPVGDPKLTECDESTICPGLFLCGPQVRQGKQILCFVYKYRQRFAVVLKEIATRLGMEEDRKTFAKYQKIIAQVEAECREQHMFLADPSCAKHSCGAGSAC